MSTILHDQSEKIKNNSLEDKSSRGKDRPWKHHKKNSVLLSESYDRMGREKRKQRVADCGNFLKFAACPSGHEKFLRKANFCGVRLCPMCGWRRSLKAAYQIKKVAHVAAKSINMRYIFLTLTCKNVEGYELPDQLHVLTKSWKRLTETVSFEKSVLGFFRATEVSRDSDYILSNERYQKNKKYYDGLMIKPGDENPNFNTYHPHFHIIIAVKPSYFKGKNYIKAADWCQMWRKAMRVDYDPIIDVRVVKQKRDQEAEKKLLEEKTEDIPGSAVAELAKYATKAEDFIIPDNKIDTDEAVEILELSLKGKKLFAYGGVLKDVYDYLRKNGDVSDIEDEKTDLIHSDEKEEKNCKCSACESTLIEEYYHWMPRKNNYYRQV